MLPDPLHPAIVHFPIVLIMFLPVVVAIAIRVRHRSGIERPVWIPVVALAALALLGGWYAEQTGEDEEDRVEKVVAHDPIHEHEESAERVVRILVVATAAAALGLLGGRIGMVSRWVTLVVAIIAVPMMLTTAESGGELVWKHGAAAAYVDATNPPPPDRHAEDEEDDD